MRQMAERIRGARRILLSTHQDPDGDGIGSILALTIALRRSGIEVQPILPDPCPTRFRFLDPDGWLSHLGPGATTISLSEPDLVLILDTHRWELLGHLGEMIRTLNAPTIFLDHHPVPGARRNDVTGDANASSTGELVYRLIHHHLDLPIDARIGECIYTAIAYDTHSFRYVRNSPSAHLVAADLLSRGVDANHIYRHLFASNPVGKMRLLGKILGSIQISEGGRLAWAELPWNEICDHAVDLDELRDAVNYLLEVDGVEVAVLLKEVEGGEIKVSFRSKGRIEIREVAQKLGGGGHIFAAGASLNGGLESARRRVHDLIRPLVVGETVPCCGGAIVRESL